MGFGEVDSGRERGREEPEAVGGGEERRYVPEAAVPALGLGKEGLRGEEGRQAQHEELKDRQAFGENEARGMRSAEDVGKPEGVLDRAEDKGAAECERCRPEQAIAIFHGSHNVLRGTTPADPREHSAKKWLRRFDGARLP